jgi:hypothetical protein
VEKLIFNEGDLAIFEGTKIIGGLRGKPIRWEIIRIRVRSADRYAKKGINLPEYENQRGA